MSLFKTSRKCSPESFYLSPLTALKEGLERLSAGEQLSIPRGAFGAVQRMLNEAHYAFERGLIDSHKYSSLPEAQRRYSPNRFDVMNSLRTQSSVINIYRQVTGNKLEYPEEQEKAIGELSEILLKLQENPTGINSQQRRLLARFFGFMVSKGIMDEVYLTSHEEDE